MKKINRQLKLYFARLGFPKIWDAEPIVIAGQPKGDPQYSTQVAIDAYDPFFADIIAKIQQAEQEIVAEAWPEGPPSILKRALMWGPEAHPKDPNLTKSWVLHANAKQDQPPTILVENPAGSRNMVTLTKEAGRELIYSGCEAHVAVGLFSYTRTATDGGIGCALNLVIPTGRAFPRFDNRATGASMVEDMPTGAPVAPELPGMPPEQGAPQAPPSPAGPPAAAGAPPQWEQAAAAPPPAAAAPPPVAQPQAPLSPDGKFYWDGVAWQPVS